MNKNVEKGGAKDVKKVTSIDYPITYEKTREVVNYSDSKPIISNPATMYKDLISQKEFKDIPYEVVRTIVAIYYEDNGKVVAKKLHSEIKQMFSAIPLNKKGANIKNKNKIKTEMKTGGKTEYAKGGGVKTVKISELKKDMIVYPIYGSYAGKKGNVVKIMPDNKTVEVVFKHKVGNDYAKFMGNELTTNLKYANGGGVDNEELELKKMIKSQQSYINEFNLNGEEVPYVETKKLIDLEKELEDLKNYAKGGGVNNDMLSMDLKSIKLKYPKAKVSYTFAKDSSGKGYVITARENGKVVYTSYKMAKGGGVDTFVYTIGGL